MTSEMFCPVCGNFLATDVMGDNYFCHNPDCVMHRVSMSQKQWRTLVQTKQDLEVVRKALKEYANEDNWGCIEDDRDRFIHTYWYFDGCNDGGWVNAQKALGQIEHKE